MNKVLLNQIPDNLPLEIVEYIKNHRFFDGSCSPEAKVYFIEKDGGYFLKIAAKNSLHKG